MVALPKWKGQNEIVKKNLLLIRVEIGIDVPL